MQLSFSMSEDEDVAKEDKDITLKMTRLGPRDKPYRGSLRMMRG